MTSTSSKLIFNWNYFEPTLLAVAIYKNKITKNDNVTRIVNIVETIQVKLWKNCNFNFACYNVVRFGWGLYDVYSQFNTKEIELTNPPLHPLLWSEWMDPITNPLRGQQTILLYPPKQPTVVKSQLLVLERKKRSWVCSWKWQNVYRNQLNSSPRSQRFDKWLSIHSYCYNVVTLIKLPILLETAVLTEMQWCWTVSFTNGLTEFWTFRKAKIILIIEPFVRSLP